MPQPPNPPPPPKAQKPTPKSTKTPKKTKKILIFSRLRAKNKAEKQSFRAHAQKKNNHLPGLAQISPRRRNSRPGSGVIENSQNTPRASWRRERRATGVRLRIVEAERQGYSTAYLRAPSSTAARPDPPPCVQTVRSGEWPAWFFFWFSGRWRAFAQGTAWAFLLGDSSSSTAASTIQHG